MSDFTPLTHEYKVAADSPSELAPYLDSVIKEALAENNLSDSEITADVDATMPLEDALITVTIQFASGAALAIFKGIILPKLQRRFNIEQNSTKEKTDD